MQDFVVLETGHVLSRSLVPPGTPCGPKGVFVAIEGIDGSGKTTLSKALVRALAALGQHAVYTTEPFDRVRFDLATWRAGDFLHDREAHVRDFIKPHLLAGIHVISDRYAGSQFAYQRVPWRVACPYEPDVTLLLDTPLNVCAGRVRSRGEDPSGLAAPYARYERLEDYTRVRRVSGCDAALAVIERLLTPRAP